MDNKKKGIGIFIAAIMVISVFASMCTPVNAATQKQIDKSIEDGIVWLAAQQNPGGSWGNINKPARTAFALIKLETHATNMGKNPFDNNCSDGVCYGGVNESDNNCSDGTCYADNVTMGYKYLFENSASIVTPLPITPAGNNPDTNGNGQGVGFNVVPSCYIGADETYTTGIALTAIALSDSPNVTVGAPGPLAAVVGPLVGMDLKTIAQDTVDYLAHGQNDLGWPQGGWGYCANHPSWSDQSNSGYAVLGLGFAEKFDNVTVPAWVKKPELDVWINYIQSADGGSGYTAPGFSNILRTGNLIFEMAFVGDNATIPRVQNATAYLENNWQQPNWNLGWGYNMTTSEYQAMYLVTKGLEYMEINETDTGDGFNESWFNQEPTDTPSQDFASTLVAQQGTGSAPPGAWPVTLHDYASPPDYILSTEWALLTLQKVVPPPLNQPPNVTDAYPSIDCLWPPNHKFVDITIEGVTDPDGDVVTITITNITSDEPTASIKGAGGDKHAPDASGVGTDTASLRAERSGTGNGRVYEITFVASDGIADTVGNVTVCVPHDYRGKCVCGNIDDGQIYDATQINV